ncbi:MAG: hypothetical protein KJZ93_32670 [Caldilineaceae bacterium]|nr:hypothetical protein [Caldilineaceae bacterium]
MTQRVPADARLGRTHTGKKIGYRVLNLSRSSFSAFTTKGVEETGIPGHYVVLGGIEAPDAGGYIVWGTKGEDIAEASIEPAPPDQAADMLKRIAAMLDSLSERILHAISLLSVPAPAVEMQSNQVQLDTTQLEAAVTRLAEMAEAATQLRRAVIIAEHMSGNLKQYADTMARVQEVEADQRRKLVAIDDFLRTVKEALA